MTVLKRLKVLATLPILMASQMSFAQPEQAAPPSSQLTPFKAKYILLHKKDEVGFANRSLIKLADGSYQFSYETDLEWFIFSDYRMEISKLTIENGVAQPNEYQFVRRGTGKDKKYHLTFDKNQSTTTNVIKNKTQKVEWVEKVQDKLSYLLQARLNLKNNVTDYNFSVFNRDGNIDLNRYQFEVVGEEDLILPYGIIKTVKVKREIPDKKKATYAWFAPELDYLLVKLYHQKGGFEQFEAQLDTLELLDEDVNVE